jgi:hypothetical protein
VGRINHPIKTGRAVSLPLAAVDPVSVESTLTPRRRVGNAAPAGTGRACLIARWLQPCDAGIAAAGGIGIAMLAPGGGLLGVRLRSDHLDPATR